MYHKNSDINAFREIVKATEVTLRHIQSNEKKYKIEKNILIIVRVSMYLRDMYLLLFVY